MTELSRRALLTGAAVGTVAASVFVAATGQARTTPPPAADPDLRYLGRRIRIGHDDIGGGAPGVMPMTGPKVLIDDDELHLMVNADGTVTTVVHHHRTYPTVLDAARAAVEDLRGARLVALPNDDTGRYSPFSGGLGGGGAAPLAAPYQRLDHRSLTAAQRKAFVDAVLALKRSGAYDGFVRSHLRYITADGDKRPRVAHHAPSFLPWHRRFLLDFESALRSVNPAVTLPYWNWAEDRATTSPLWAADFLGGNGRASDAQVTTGPFAYSTGHWPLKYGVDNRRFLRRTVGRDGTLPSVQDRAAVLGVTPYDTAPWNSTSPGGLRNQLEGWRGPRLHNRVHEWVGGTMSSGASPNDPLFWLHHCYVDYLWAQWQARHPGQGYLPAKPTKDVIALDEPLRPYSDTPRDMLDHTRFYTYA